MSCLPCLECGEGAGVTRENLDRWTDSIANILASPEGRHHFKRFLESRSLDESLNAIEFWEHCSRVMPKRLDGGDSPPHSSVQASGSVVMSQDLSSGASSCTHSSQSDSAYSKLNVSDDLRRKLQLLVDFADKYVNFDLAQLRCLYQMLRKTEVDAVVETLTQAKQATMELLLDDYQLFKEHLLEKHGSLNK